MGPGVDNALGFVARDARSAHHAAALAILFHDAIYEAGKPDNEARSAELARAWIGQYLPEYMAEIERVRALIMLTARHGRIDGAEMDAEAALFLDCDMAILGSAPERFAQYERAIAEEFCALPADLYRVERARFLRAVLARPAIYLSSQFKATHEAAARANMKLAWLSFCHPRAARLRAVLHGRRAVSIELEM